LKSGRRTSREKSFRFDTVPRWYVEVLIKGL
jgi:hypothetical protein